MSEGAGGTLKVLLRWLRDLVSPPSDEERLRRGVADVREAMALLGFPVDHLTDDELGLVYHTRKRGRIGPCHVSKSGLASC